MPLELEKKIARLRSVGPFAFQYVEAITEEDTIKGGGLYLNSKCVLTIAYCNNPWIDDEGNPYNFKKDGDILFLRKWAISLK